MAILTVQMFLISERTPFIFSATNLRKYEYCIIVEYGVYSEYLRRKKQQKKTVTNLVGLRTVRM
jgi:hypothetical protein